MLGVEKSFRAAGEGRVLEGVRDGSREPGCRARSPVERKSSPTAAWSD